MEYRAKRSVIVPLMSLHGNRRKSFARKANGVLGRDNGKTLGAAEYCDHTGLREHPETASKACSIFKACNYLGC